MTILSVAPDASALAVTWWKSSRSAAQSDCVECGIISADAIAVRDSKAPTGPALIFGRSALAAMVDAVTDGTL
ncbi:DUF397 domain-containing protein [Streptomyces sp. NBC_01237]|uniref:DUF397 domain-containing protein n=1 Tax=Streptomyces sp. NBC_01237 TaxID=2903790 RepID=UPI002DDBDBC1|nr:DUF397 domain-containing protein [Streptomyces sp. NBC_01237]WRZ73768.1 DUF397 domain-containing protein [Streptomyces sp. NBC_01237]